MYKIVVREIRLYITLTCLLCVGAMVGSAATRRAGLWEITTTTTWQQSPLAPGTSGDPASGGTRTKQVCLTQEMIDRYGALLPQSRGQCSVENKVLKPGGMTADWVCKGMMNGTGALESTWSDAEHSRSKVHFLGTFQVGGEAQPIEWTTESTAVFKSASCGMVKPEKTSGSRQ